MKKAKDAQSNILLKRAREERAMTQQQIADHLHTTKVSVSRWENGTSSPSSFFRTQLCQFFQKSPKALGFVEEETSEQPSSPPLYWNIPYQRNPFFIGHQALLEHLLTTAYNCAQIN